jgi:putative addiction module killer protein
MIELKQTETFRKWRLRLKDEKARALIASRLDPLSFGNAGDITPVGQGIWAESELPYPAAIRIDGIFYQEKSHLAEADRAYLF